jgi:predicted nuclease of predicted toxin-antitoxin system
MSLRFFADQCVPYSVIRALRDEGHKVLILKEHIPSNSPDSVVIIKAQELDAILISLNGDFSDIVTYPPSNYKGIIALQVKNHPEVMPMLMKKLIKYFIAHPEMDQYKGQLLLVEVHRIRIRK